MDMKQFLHSTTPEDREKLAKKVGSSVEYFWQIAGGHRKPGARLCRELEKHSGGKIKASVLRPEYFA